MPWNSRSVCPYKGISMDCKVRGQRERKYEISIIVVVSVDDCAVLKIITRHPQSKLIVAKIGDLS